MVVWIVTIIALLVDLALLVLSVNNAMHQPNTSEGYGLGLAQVVVTLFIIVTTSLPAFIRTVHHPRKGSLVALLLALVLPTITVLILTNSPERVPTGGRNLIKGYELNETRNGAPDPSR